MLISILTIFVMFRTFRVYIWMCGEHSCDLHNKITLVTCKSMAVIIYVTSVLVLHPEWYVSSRHCSRYSSYFAFRFRWFVYPNAYVHIHNKYTTCVIFSLVVCFTIWKHWICSRSDKREIQLHFTQFDLSFVHHLKMISEHLSDSILSILWL